MVDTVLLSFWQVGTIGFVLGFATCYILAIILSLHHLRHPHQKTPAQPVERMDEDMKRRLAFLRHLVQTGRVSDHG